jgi:hypothetical protein
MGSSAATTPQAVKTPAPQGKTHRPTPLTGTPDWEAPGGQLSAAPGNRAIGKLLQNHPIQMTVTAPTSIAQLANSMQRGGAHAVAALISGVRQPDTAVSAPVPAAAIPDSQSLRRADLTMQSDATRVPGAMPQEPLRVARIGPLDQFIEPAARAEGIAALSHRHRGENGELAAATTGDLGEWWLDHPTRARFDHQADVNLELSGAQQREGRPLDDHVRSAFESAFARTHIAPITSTTIEHYTADGHPVATPASTAEHEADRVADEVVPSRQPDIGGSHRPDFSKVRIHADDEAGRAADSLQANAFTLGSHIFFGPGQYDTGSPRGKRLLAHELTHVLQSPQTQCGEPDITRQAPVFRQSWIDKASKWYDEKKWAVYRAMIAGLQKAKNAGVSAMRSQLPKAPASLQSALGTVIDVVDFVIDMLIALLLVIIGLVVGFAEGIVTLVTGIIKMLYGLLKLIVDWVVAVLGKPEAYTEDVNALVAAIKGIPEGLKKTIDDWVERYKKATPEQQVLMGGELIGQIEAFIATFALAGTKAGQATTLTVRAPAGVDVLNVGSKGARAAEAARAVTVTVPAVVPKTAAEGAVVASQMTAMGGGGGGGGGGGSKPPQSTVTGPERTAINNFADAVETAAADQAAADPDFLARLESGRQGITQAGTRFHTLAKAEVVKASKSALPGYTVTPEAAISADSRLDVLIETPSGGLAEIDWKTSIMGGMQKATREGEMGRHAAAVAAKYGRGLAVQESRSWGPAVVRALRRAGKVDSLTPAQREALAPWL